jgi:hypothetical protein
MRKLTVLSTNLRDIVVEQEILEKAGKLTSEGDEAF